MLEELAAAAVVEVVDPVVVVGASAALWVLEQPATMTRAAGRRNHRKRLIRSPQTLYVQKWSPTRQ